jgi:hypothetical protein
VVAPRPALHVIAFIHRLNTALWCVRLSAGFVAATLFDWLSPHLVEGASQDEVKGQPNTGDRRPMMRANKVSNSEFSVSRLSRILVG